MIEVRNINGTWERVEYAEIWGQLKAAGWSFVGTSADPAGYPLMMRGGYINEFRYIPEFLIYYSDRPPNTEVLDIDNIPETHKDYIVIEEWVNNERQRDILNDTMAKRTLRPPTWFKWERSV